MVMTIAHNHNFGSVKTAVHSRSNACVCSGSAGSIFDNEEKSHGIVAILRAGLGQCGFDSFKRARATRQKHRLID